MRDGDTGGPGLFEEFSGGGGERVRTWLGTASWMDRQVDQLAEIVGVATTR